MSEGILLAPTTLSSSSWILLWTSGKLIMYRRRNLRNVVVVSEPTYEMELPNQLITTLSALIDNLTKNKSNMVLT